MPKFSPNKKKLVQAINLRLRFSQKSRKIVDFLKRKKLHSEL